MGYASASAHNLCLCRDNCPWCCGQAALRRSSGAHTPIRAMYGGLDQLSLEHGESQRTWRLFVGFWRDGLDILLPLLRDFCLSVLRAKCIVE